MGVRPIEDIWLVDFFRDNRLLDSSVIAVARSVGCASLESTCELIDLGGGDGGSLMMVACVVDFPYISLCVHPIRPQLWSLIVETSLLTITCKKLCIHS